LASACGDAYNAQQCGGGDFVFGGGIAAPVYEKPFSEENSCKFSKEYRAYARNIKLSIQGQTVQRPLLKLGQLLPPSIRQCLKDYFFEDAEDEEELVESDLQRGLAQHGKCWTGSEKHTDMAVAEVESMLAMRSESKAVSRLMQQESAWWSASKIRAWPGSSARKENMSRVLLGSLRRLWFAG